MLCSLWCPGSNVLNIFLCWILIKIANYIPPWIFARYIVIDYNCRYSIFLLKSDSCVTLKRFGGKIVMVIRWSARSSSDIVSAMGSVFPLPIPGSEATNASKPRRSARITGNYISHKPQQWHSSRSHKHYGNFFCPHCSSRQEIPLAGKRLSVFTVEMRWENSFGLQVRKTEVFY